MEQYGMREITECNLGSSVNNGVLRVGFKKTINIRQYETEVIDITLDIPLAEGDLGAKFPVVEQVAIVKAEYGAMLNLLANGRITQDEFNNWVKNSTNIVNSCCSSFGFGLNDL